MPPIFTRYRTSIETNIFLLPFRIAEALVVSQESCLNTSNGLQHLEDEGRCAEPSAVINGLKANASGLPDNSGTSDPALEENDRLTESNAPNPMESCTSSPSSGTTISVRTLSPKSPSTSPPLPESSPTSVQVLGRGNHTQPPQMQQGLLYSLLVGGDGGINHPRSPLQNLSPLLNPTRNGSPSLSNSTSKMSVSPAELLTDRQIDGEKLFPPASFSSSSSGSHHSNGAHESYDSHFNPPSYPRIAPPSSPNFRHRANSLGSKASNNRPYIRPHAASVGTSSDYYSSVKARLQNRRQMEASHLDHRLRTDVRYRGYSKSQENNSSSTISSETSLLNLSISNFQLTSNGSSGTSSPRTVQQSLSAQPRLVNAGPSVCSSFNSSGYCSAGAHRSPLLSSASADSGLDEPIDLTGCPFITFSNHKMNAAQTFPVEVARNGDSDLQTVQLAKKTARPVQARVTEWLRQATEFVALAVPVINKMKVLQPTSNGTNGHISDVDLWVTVLSKCWHRLLALSMAEHALDVVIVEDRSPFEEAVGALETDQLSLPWILLPDVQKYGVSAVSAKSRRPGRKFANNLLQLLSEIRQAGLNAHEFYLLRHVVLLTADEPAAISSLGLNVIRASRSMDVDANSGKLACMILKNSCDTSANVHNSAGANGQTNAVSFDLACLVCGLKQLGHLCPYRMANLFCTHLRSASSLSKPYLLELHKRFLTAQCELKSISMLQPVGENFSESRANDLPQDQASILEQLFDSS
ncbi:unnamed protein product [Calicophoron daubneyi]|uniref:Uncharacterized protein n=1 Tax=Calicophoron daubneyi TaxID=300641 RepID=A0AAV2T7A8_CALDB